MNIARQISTAAIFSRKAVGRAWPGDPAVVGWGARPGVGARERGFVAAVETGARDVGRGARPAPPNEIRGMPAAADVEAVGGGLIGVEVGTLARTR